MQEISPVYRQENGTYLIEITLSNLDELFNPLDPSPFHKKDLVEEVETYIVDGAQDFSLKASQKIVLYLPKDEVEKVDEALLNRAMFKFFSYRYWSSERNLRKLFRDARISLLVGMSVLFSAVVIQTLISQSYTAHWAVAISEGSMIAGWVSVWHPTQKLLYDWWPLKRSLQIFEKLKKVPVECRPEPEELSATTKL